MDLQYPTPAPAYEHQFRSSCMKQNIEVRSKHHVHREVSYSASTVEEIIV